MYVSQLNHSRKLYEVLEKEKAIMEDENSELMKNTADLQEKTRSMELEIVVAQKNVSLIQKLSF